MLKRSFMVVTILFFLILLTGCGAGNFAVTNGLYSGTIAYTEDRNNGSYMIWPVISIDTVWCVANKKATQNDDFAEEAQRLHATVLIEYQSINAGDPDGVNPTGLGYGCDDESAGVQTYRMLSICEMQFSRYEREALYKQMDKPIPEVKLPLCQR